VLGEIREPISDELDYEIEAQHQRRLERRFRGHRTPVVAHRSFDCALLAPRRRRARGRVERAVAAQLHEARVPCDDIAVAARDRRTQIVIDELARDAAGQSNVRTWPSRDDSIVMSSERCAVAAPE